MIVRRLSGKRGFTLVEALIASLVMVIGLLVVVSAVSIQTVILNKNREETIATLTAQGELELLRGRLFGNVASGPFYKEDAPGLEYLHYGSGPGTGEIIVDSPGFTGDSNIKRVSVTVKWDSVDGKASQKTIATLMTNGGINRQ